MRVLYVGGKKTWHLFIEKVLSLRGIEVLHAYSFREGINVSHTEKPNAVIVDYKINDIPLTQFLSDFKTTGVPLIVVGYKSEGMDSDSLLREEAFRVLEKPFTVEELILALKELKEELPQIKKEPETLEIVSSGGEPLPVINLDEVETEATEPEERREELEVIPVSKEELSKLKTDGGEREKVPMKETLISQTAETVEKNVPEDVVGQIDKKEIERIVKEVVWEVVPPLAEKIIREEIRKLIESRLA